MNQKNKKPTHLIRGVLISVILGPVMIVSGLFTASFLIAGFIAGWIPSQWFSTNAFDWLVAGGTVNGAGNFYRGLFWAIITSASYVGVRWGYYGNR